MLERVDRIQLAVRDRDAAARVFARVLEAVPVGETASAHLGARITVLAMGESEVELCAPTGAGRVADHLARQGEGLMAAGFATRDVGALGARLRGLGVAFAEDAGRIYLDPADTVGMPVVVSETRPRPRVGLVRHLYEVTNTVVSDWRAAALRFTGLFGLDPARFAPIHSGEFGYAGTLTLFDPPGRLDRIEISQVIDGDSAMGRWTRRRGDSLYMCYVEVDEVRPLVERLDARGARWTPRGPDRTAEADGLWVHPSALCGLLLGVSRTTLAWEWSGRPSLVAPRPD